MPKVGKKKFPYTKAGVKAAKKVMKRGGVEAMMKKPMMKKMKKVKKMK